MEINGAALGAGIAAFAYDPAAGITIGSMYGAGQFATPYFRGADAIIDEVTLYSIPEPTTFALISLLLTAGLVLCQRRRS